jgi:hypothetical protein
MLYLTIVQLDVTKHVRWDLVSSQCWACTAQGAESANALRSGGSADGIRRTGAAQLLALSQETIVAEKLADWAQLRADSPVQAISLLRFDPIAAEAAPLLRVIGCQRKIGWQVQIRGFTWFMQRGL